MTKTIWKTIEIGTKTKEELVKEIKKDMRISIYAKDMIEKIDFSEKKTIDLVNISPSEMGLKDYSTLEQIYDKSKELGLELCPPQVGPELRLNYKDQPNGEYLRIAMNPITDRDDGPGIFSVSHDGDGLWLGNGGQLVFGWSGSHRFVFASRKSLDSETSGLNERVQKLEEKVEKLLKEQVKIIKI